MSITINGNDYFDSNNRFLPGTYTVDTLPDASLYPYMYAATTDLGGGGDMLLSDGQYWKMVRRGTLANVAANTAITIDPLKSATIFVIAGTITSNMTLAITNTSRLYPGYLITIKRAAALSTVLGLVGSLGIKVGSGPNLALTDTTSNLMWDGTQFVQI